MNPQDSVLVGVINRKKDFTIAQEQHWYRVPVGNADKGIYAQYIAFFFSKAFGEMNGGIHYYAPLTGYEQHNRLTLLPDEPNHKNVEREYYQLQFRELKTKMPPILNESKRRFAFIYTTWDRFIAARTLADLYTDADYLVDRVFHALKDFKPQRRWWAQGGYETRDASVRILCEDGEVAASVYGSDGMQISKDVGVTVAAIKAQIEAQGGPRLLHTPVE